MFAVVFDSRIGPCPRARYGLPVLVDSVYGELEVGVLAVDAHLVPGEVVQAEAARTAHLGLAGAEVNVNLKLEGR